MTFKVKRPTKKLNAKLTQKASTNMVKPMNSKAATATANMFTQLTANPKAFLKTQNPTQVAALLREASALYYKGTPAIADDIFDITRDYLQTQDPHNPVLKEIGAEIAPGEKKVPLPYWMGSLDKIREDEKSLLKWKASYPGSVVISDKLDGNSALLVYSETKPHIKMYSRGDGFIGQDISHIIPLIQGIPTYKDIPYTTLAVRGELIISKAAWGPLFAAGKGANARNAVAGVMHSKHPNPELAAAVEFVAYEQLNPAAAASEGLSTLEGIGFHVVHHVIQPTASLTMESLSALLMDRRAHSPYEADGIVIFHDADHPQVPGKNPAYAFAFKSILTHEEAEVIVTEVTWNASKDGYLKPLLHFPAVTLAGAKLQKATGFNAAFIETNKIGPGSRIIIIRSGDVIPHVHKILSASANGLPSFPDVPWDWNDTHVDIVLKDKAAAADVQLKRMEYFAATLEMKGVGPGVIARLYENGVNTIKKMLNATEADLLKMDGFQKKSAEKTVAEIRAAVAKADCLTFMHASNLFGRSLGSTKLKLIVDRFPTILEGVQPTEAELSAIPGVGPTTAKQFLAGLPEFFTFMDDIGVPCKSAPAPKPISAQKSLVGISVLFTGFRNKELEAEIEARGGKVASAISGKTSVVVAKNPDDSSGKVKTAKELNIPVMDEMAFRAKYL